MNEWHTVNLLLHIVAAALWLGVSAFFWVAFGPVVDTLESAASMRALNRGRLALESLAWFGIALLMLTGMVNLLLRSQATNAHLGRPYMIVLAIKLLLFIAMLAHHSLQVFKYGPKIAALSGEAAARPSASLEPLRAQWQKWFLLLKLNAGVGALVTLLGVALVRY
jgi:uncharacterized membrane protein